MTIALAIILIVLGSFIYTQNIHSKLSPIIIGIGIVIILIRLL